MSAVVLVVEDEEDLLGTLAFNLAREGFEPRTATNGPDALRLAQQAPLPELVLLDVMLPGISGTEVCRQLRANALTAHIPVIMLTAKGEEIDRVVGLELGADDYVVKPYSVRELMLRVRAILRRTKTTVTDVTASAAAPSTAKVFGHLQIDSEAHRVHVDGVEVALTALEFRLLTLLMERRGRVQSRERLLEEVWQVSGDLTTRTVDTHVKRLRQKLGTAGDYVETVRGVGYRFSEAPEVSQ